ncbi:ATP-binding protein [Streptomyces sp. NPDC048057]|uniref:ATP-binding protein n=1 Tax=Streptomyces sp. NPDC048057 TaxID=3155628 RepID=UPI0033DCE95F
MAREATPRTRTRPFDLAEADMTTSRSNPSLRATTIERPKFGRTLHRAPTVAQEARAITTDALKAWDLGGLALDAAQIVSELIANVIRHTRCNTLTLDVQRRTERTVRISVADGCHATPEQRRASGSEVTGRGLQIVAGLSRAWGYERHFWGKVVWADIAASGAEGEGPVDTAPHPAPEPAPQRTEREPVRGHVHVRSFNGRAWALGSCWLYCRRRNVPVRWIGPVSFHGMTVPMYACKQCNAELEYMVDQEVARADSVAAG